MTILQFIGLFLLLAVVLPAVLALGAEDRQCRARRRKP